MSNLATTPAVSRVLIAGAGLAGAAAAIGLAAGGVAANQINEFTAAKSFNGPDRGLFTAPPV